jgi:hypothetical protein
MVVAVPKGKSQAALDALKAIVSEAISSGLIRRAIDLAKLKGVRAAE